MTDLLNDIRDVHIAIGITVSLISLLASYAIFDMISNRNKYTLSEEEKDIIWQKICLSLDEQENIEHDTKQDN